jgi:type II secretory pathway component PulF
LTVALMKSRARSERPRSNRHKKNMMRFRQAIQHTLSMLPIVGWLLRKYHALSVHRTLALLATITMSPAPAIAGSGLSPELAALMDKNRRAYRNLIRKLNRAMLCPIIVLVTTLIILTVILFALVPDLADLFFRSATILHEQAK